MEKYKILLAELHTTKKLTQKEIEQSKFRQFYNTIIYETNNKTEAEEILKRLVNFKHHKKYYYDKYYKKYTYKRFELVKEIIDYKKTNYKDYKSLGYYFPNYEKEDEEDE